MTKRTRIALSTLALLATASLPLGRAEEAPAGPTAAKEQKVRKLLELNGADKLGQQAVDMMTARFQPMEAAGKLPPGYGKKFVEMADPKELTEPILPAYMKNLSEEDLDAIIAFYGSPAGQHLALALPVINRENAEASQKWSKAMSQKVLAALKNGAGGLAPEESPVH